MPHPDQITTGQTEAFCAIRSYLATAAKHGTTWFDALTTAASGSAWLPSNT